VADVPDGARGAPAKRSAAGPSAIRSLIRRAGEAVGAARALLEGDERARQAVRDAYGAMHADALRERLAEVPVERLKEIVPRLPAARLEKAGFANVGAVLDAGPQQLEQIRGVGPRSAAQAVAAARRVAETVGQDVRITADVDPDDEKGAKLLAALHKVQSAQTSVERARDPARRIGDQFGKLMTAARPLSGRVRRALAGRERRETARDAAVQLEEALAAPATERDLKRIETANKKLTAAPARPATVRRDFEKRAADYFAALAQILGTRDDAEAARGFLPDDLIGSIEKQPLDTTHLRVSLRAYQEFGARFALAGRRVVLGDEMGCGKTVEAIAAMAHLRAEGERHFLVVCPASVLINWMREVRGHSSLKPYRLHGGERDENLVAWAKAGGVGVTTYETVRSLPVPTGRTRVAMLVVDEAHYVKNPDAQRSKALREWTRRVDRVLFLTGTPMENRVEEFRNLVGYLQPGLVDAVDGIDAIAGSKAFRRAVAPAYLRRNQEDVLSELPELTRVDEWEEFGPQDFAAYRQAVDEGNFMAIRRAAYAAAAGTGSARGSAKLRRLVEIADEAGESGRKVVVFSYFRDVLDTVCEALGGRALGPLTGSMPPPRRQELVDEFAAAHGHKVLVSQIQAGGVGINMQAASVVILCEPQVKPTLETQAIARAHRLGQVRKVQVHRLLVADSVDERMLELLEGKSALFDAYARRSDTADAVPQARDVSEAELARKVVDAERARLKLQTPA
jgi:superfamily II DNA or RNA helicase